MRLQFRVVNHVKPASVPHIIPLCLSSDYGRRPSVWHRNLLYHPINAPLFLGLLDLLGLALLPIPSQLPDYGLRRLLDSLIQHACEPDCQLFDVKMGIWTWKSPGVSQEANQVRPKGQNGKGSEENEVEHGLEGLCGVREGLKCHEVEVQYYKVDQ